jgi:hypothetical protein
MPTLGSSSIHLYRHTIPIPAYGWVAKIVLSKPNSYTPNNELYILIYRKRLPLPLPEEKMAEFRELHDWGKVALEDHISVRHFHLNTPEYYGKYEIHHTLSVFSKLLPDSVKHSQMFQDNCAMLVGCGSSSNKSEGGKEIDLRAGMASYFLPELDIAIIKVARPTSTVFWRISRSE